MWRGTDRQTQTHRRPWSIYILPRLCLTRNVIKAVVPPVWLPSSTTQEGQHPLTGQRAANFRLLANQWAKRRLVTQWRHSCRAMRRTVCNTGASNAGRSLCIQISRERSYPLPTYWYHSKGNWLRYNFAAESFYILKLCSRLFVLYCQNCPKHDKFRYFIPMQFEQVRGGV